MNLRPKFISIPDNIQHTSSDANNELEPGQHRVLDVLDSKGTSSNTLLLLRWAGTDSQGQPWPDSWQLRRFLHANCSDEHHPGLPKAGEAFLFTSGRPSWSTLCQFSQASISSNAP